MILGSMIPPKQLSLLDRDTAGTNSIGANGGPSRLSIPQQIRLDLDRDANGKLVRVNIENTLSCHPSEYARTVHFLEELLHKLATAGEVYQFVIEVISGLKKIKAWREANGYRAYRQE